MKKLLLSNTQIIQEENTISGDEEEIDEEEIEMLKKRIKVQRDIGGSIGNIIDEYIKYAEIGTADEFRILKTEKILKVQEL